MSRIANPTLSDILYGVKPPPTPEQEIEQLLKHAKFATEKGAYNVALHLTNRAAEKLKNFAR